MILDNLTLLAGAMSATGVLTGQSANGAGSILSTNTLDIASLSLGGNQVGDTGAGGALDFSITVMTAPTVGASVQFQLIQADDAALTTNVQVIDQTDALPIAMLTAGTSVPLAYDRAVPFLPKRYIGVRFVNVGAVATASYLACLAQDIQSLKPMIFKAGFIIA